MTEKTACFTGHRNIANQQILEVVLYFKLKSTIQKAIDDGYTHFITGMAVGFDMLAAQALIEIKKTHLEIIIECAVPCENQTRKWDDEDIREYEHLKNQCDIITVLSKKYTPDCMFERNRYMVDKSSIVIAAYNGKEKSGTAQTINYAKSKGIEVVNLI